MDNIYLFSYPVPPPERNHLLTTLEVEFDGSDIRYPLHNYDIVKIEGGISIMPRLWIDDTFEDNRTALSWCIPDELYEEDTTTDGGVCYTTRNDYDLRSFLFDIIDRPLLPPLEKTFHLRKTWDGFGRNESLEWIVDALNRPLDGCHLEIGTHDDVFLYRGNTKTLANYDSDYCYFLKGGEIQEGIRIITWRTEGRLNNEYYLYTTQQGLGKFLMEVYEDSQDDDDGELLMTIDYSQEPQYEVNPNEVKWATSQTQCDWQQMIMGDADGD